MRTFKLTLAYDGTNYAGWQSQPDRPTIQSTLEAVLRRVTGEQIRTVASGRTDAGVHALAQVASFQSETQLTTDVLCRAFNAYLPADIVVTGIEQATTGFHAIRAAIRKRYRYVITDGGSPNPFEHSHVWSYPTRLDAVAMGRAAKYLLGEHDFASFETSGSDRKTSIRNVLEVDVRRGPALFAFATANQVSEAIWIDIEADGFLYNMVRNIVGTLAEVGRGVQPESWVGEVLCACDRRKAGPTAPPQGLYLVRVDYSPNRSNS
jgi:tRNA pseudouridine38-40 synthase